MVISSLSQSQLRRVRQILKSLADDTRLRIINLLSVRELNVTSLCEVLDKKQPVISKHLARLRHVGLVGDRRQGMNVYYYLSAASSDRIQGSLVSIIVKGLHDLRVFREDLKQIKKEKNRKIGGKT